MHYPGITTIEIYKKAFKTSTSTLNKLRNDLRLNHPAQAQEIAAMIAEIKAGETNELLRYGAF